MEVEICACRAVRFLSGERLEFAGKRGAQLLGAGLVKRVARDCLNGLPTVLAGNRERAAPRASANRAAARLVEVGLVGAKRRAVGVDEQLAGDRVLNVALLDERGRSAVWAGEWLRFWWVGAACERLPLPHSGVVFGVKMAGDVLVGELVGDVNFRG